MKNKNILNAPRWMVPILRKLSRHFKRKPLMVELNSETFTVAGFDLPKRDPLEIKSDLPVSIAGKIVNALPVELAEGCCSEIVVPLNGGDKTPRIYFHPKPPAHS